MLKKNKILCYYFSGTGNTKSLVDRFVGSMKNEGYEISICKMERDSFPETDEEFTLGLMFPVAIQSTFPLVWEFVENLPNGKGRDVFMFDTMESFSGGIVGPLKKVLTRKGYNCIAAREFKMSSSMNTTHRKVAFGQRKNISALKEVENFAEDLIEGRAEWPRVPIFSDWMRSISKSRKIWTSNSQKISVSEDCIRCLICQKGCPVGAINNSSGKIAIDHSQCISCMRCAANCPKNAILFNKRELLFSRI